LEYKAKAIKTKYWIPGTDYCSLIADILNGIIKENDIVVISEKAISTAKGKIINESNYSPSYLAKFIAHFWMRYFWGFLLGYICHIRLESINRLRKYPLKEGANHKEISLKFSGFLDTLKNGSEGGIDVSNLPYAFASLPLNNPNLEAKKIQEFIIKKININVSVMIVDSDKTYSYRNFHITCRKNAIKGISTWGGILTYSICRALKLKPRATPIAISGIELNVNDALSIAETSHAIRGSGAGKTAWDVAARFKVNLIEVSWSMLSNIDHYPIVIFRKK
jgi:F420-0:gamma-glutamyl ligase-like protein